MRYLAFISLLLTVLSGCGSNRVDYTPMPPAAMTRQQAIEIVEQGFYEDYGKKRPVHVDVTERYILLADGVISKGSGFASATPVGTGAIAAGTSTTITKEMGQRIYFNNLGRTTIHQKRTNPNRCTVVLRAFDQSDVRAIHTRSLAHAQRFADAIEVLRSASQVK
ncbi:hypothetical protein [Pseudomonas donghuensis]|uniref:hypothetical protein n=1 Tax=Pseudomonas donghuensis TaxID=1163398 RepID=UPI0020C576D9|nr:hypothetical protein [Pseudomonas donghuensis]MCP6695892.1 hypothetical protein [Pseudomonas donghuensis]